MERGNRRILGLSDQLDDIVNNPDAYPKIKAAVLKSVAENSFSSTAMKKRVIHQLRELEKQKMIKNPPEELIRAVIGLFRGGEKKYRLRIFKDDSVYLITPDEIESCIKDLTNHEG